MEGLHQAVTRITAIATFIGQPKQNTQYKLLHKELITNSYPVNLLEMGICGSTTTTTQASTFKDD